jgi:Serine incorporator (Serinc)
MVRSLRNGAVEYRVMNVKSRVSLPSFRLQGSIIGCLASNAAFCCCTASLSLLTSCCGSEKPSSVAPGASSGRIRSVILLVISVALQLVFQFALAPWFVDNAASWKTVVISDIWLDDCANKGGSDEAERNAILESCVGRAGNYRVAAVTTLFFVLAALVALAKPTANREAWPAKFILYLLVVVASVFLPADPTLTPIFLSVAIGTCSS